MPGSIALPWFNAISRASHTTRQSEIRLMFETAFAQTAASGAAPNPMLQFLLLIAIFIIFYFLLIRPQQRRAKEHRALIDAVKRGDTVVTGGGLIGKVIKVEDAEVEVEIAANVKVRVIKSTITDVRAKGEPANDTTKK
jgi:preprotein translocase subunit YajC